MGRRHDALDERVGARLLQKTPSAFVLTPAGEAIFPSERIGCEAFSVERTISGKDLRPEGTGAGDHDRGTGNRGADADPGGISARNILPSPSN
jgi:hypothetical protein